jgi:hypothetical protein
MKVDIYRKVETSESITGEFWLDGVQQCVYLEPSRTTPFWPGHPCIDAGTYQVVLTISPHLGYICPEVLNVLCRIRWHVGNFPEDVLGCCVVGTTIGENLVESSRGGLCCPYGQAPRPGHHGRVSRSATTRRGWDAALKPIWRRIAE